MTLIRTLAAAAVLAVASLAGSGSALAQGVELFAVLLGGNEVTSASAGNPDGGARVGDPDGYGTASVIYVGRDGLCFTLAVTNIDKPIAAHIHRGLAGVNGSVAITLLPPSAPSSGNPGVSAGCLTGVAPAILNPIRQTPSAFYVNVHTSKFPNGALRGQLF